MRGSYERRPRQLPRKSEDIRRPKGKGWERACGRCKVWKLETTDHFSLQAGKFRTECRPCNVARVQARQEPVIKLAPVEFGPLLKRMRKLLPAFVLPQREHCGWMESCR